MGRSAASFYGASCCVSIAACLLLDQAASSVVYDVVIVAATAAMAAGILVNRPERRTAWWLLTAGIGAWVIGDVIGSANVIRGGVEPLAGIPGIFYVAGYPIAGAALVLLGWGVEPERARRILLDAAVIVLALGLALWVPALNPIFDDGRGASLAHLLAIAYPIGDIVLIGVAIRIVLAGARGQASLAIVAAFGAVLTGDLLNGSGRPGLASAGDTSWLLAYVLLGGAALFPSMRQFTPPHSAPVRAWIARLGGYALALALLPVTLLAERLTGRRFEDPFLYASVGLVLTALVVTRFALLFTDGERARVRAEGSERTFRMIFEHAPVGITLGRDGMLSETNPALQKMLGYTGEELAALHFSAVMHPDDLDHEAQAELEAGTRDSFTAEPRYLRKDGGIVDVRLHVTRGLQGGLGMALIEDIGARQALEERLREAHRLEAVGKLAGGVAHDFNNLMTAVGGYADLLLRDLDDRELDDEAARRRVVAIKESAARAADLTRQLLAFGRRQVLQVSELDLRDVVTGVEKPLQAALGPRARLETALSGRPVRVQVDPSQLEQVLLNLAENAGEAMAPGGTLHLAVDENEGQAVLTVSDTGRGMTPAVRARIFEPFFTTKSPASSSGLGLATVHGIVHQSGGSIDVESAPGDGTRFTIRLPLAGSGATID